MDPRKALEMDDPAAHDAQRELERRALKNVRALIDKLEGQERRRRSGSLKVLAWLVAGMAVAIAIGYAMLLATQGPGETRVIITAPGKGPAAPQPPR